MDSVHFGVKSYKVDRLLFCRVSLKFVCGVVVFFLFVCFCFYCSHEDKSQTATRELFLNLAVTFSFISFLAFAQI